MPTRKQRRRRQKDLRHEWEEVYVDAEGRELDPEEVAELVPPRAESNGKAERAKPARGPAKSSQRTRPVRDVPPPSWRRVVKRTAIFAPLMFLFIAVTSKNTGPVEDAVVTIWLMLIFAPFSYLMDRIMYRLWQKRVAGATGAKRR